MNSKELREKFVKFFENKGHKLVPPASLIPENDPSVLFTSAGMQQFKKYYTNPEEALEKFGSKNVVTIQPCIRTSDIDEVGDDTHLTFFEMLGNFSFSGYGKKEAIEWGYELLTKELEIKPTRIMCSIFGGDDINSRDDESAKILESMNLKYEEHNRKDNFWGPTGNEGPCGPTVELYIDGIEVWNLVFNEYYLKDGKYEKLATLGVDTGMGFERILVVLNDLNDVYQSDVFMPIINKIEEINGLKFVYGDKIDAEYIKEGKQCWVDARKQFRIIADHLKAAVFLLDNNINPDKIGRGYITRRLIRRSIIQSRKMQIQNPLEIIKTVLEIYPEIKNDNVISEFKKESSKFNQTLERGLKEFEKVDVISGETAFKLFETYGFPIELTEELAKEKNIQIDINEFEKASKKHQEISRAGISGFKGGLVGESEITTQMHTATHLLLKALQEVLGKDVHQRGSNINEERIRFDFSYPQAMTKEEVEKVEDIVNEKIAENLSVEKKETTIEEAKKIGVEAQFINKYGDKVTLYSIGDFSHELCGGPHVKNTSEIGKLKIIKEESSSSGVRRIRAVLE